MLLPSSLLGIWLLKPLMPPPQLFTLSFHGLPDRLLISLLNAPSDGADVLGQSWDSSLLHVQLLAFMGWG